MIITIADAVFAALESASDRQAHSRMLSLLQLGDEGRHRILIDPLYEPGADRHVNRWLARRDQETLEAIDLALGRDIKAETRFALDVEIVVADVPAADWKNQPPILPLAEALNFARRPLELLVEDWQHDGMFLRVMAPADYSPRFEEALRNNWINIANAGGTGSIRRRIREARKANKPGEPDDRLRMWVMLDSDALAPGKPSDFSQSLAKECEGPEVDIPCHQLKRRAIENYLPRQALDNYTSGDPYPSGKLRPKRLVFDAYYSMQPPQRHHYNLKEGFKKDRKPQNKSLLEHFGSYQDHPDLQTGFGDTVWEEVCNHSENRKIPLPPFPESWLQADESFEEAKDILLSILQRL